MSELNSTSGLRFLLSWVEVVLGVSLVGIGAAHFVPIFRDTFGDPHGMGAILGLISSVLGLSFVVSGLFLRIRGRWPWLIQALPVLAVAVVTLFLT